MSNRWADFGKVAVRQMANVKPGETFLVLADTATDRDLTAASQQAGIDVGARAALLTIPSMDTSDASDLDPATIAAIATADVILGLCASTFVEKESTMRALEGKLRITSTNIEGMEDFVTEGIRDVDYPLMIEIGNKIGELWMKTELCRVTSPFGTDISFDMRDRPIDVGHGIVKNPGEADYFPGVSVANAPIESTIQGTIVVDGNVPPGRLVEEPVTLRVKDGIIVAFEGGADADAVREFFEASGDPIATHICHFTLGLNPRARTSGSIHQDEHVLGAITFGFGAQNAIFGGNVPPCGVHCDVVLTTGKIEIDGKVMLDNNVLSEEMGLGGIA